MAASARNSWLPKWIGGSAFWEHNPFCTISSHPSFKLSSTLWGLKVEKKRWPSPVLIFPHVFEISKHSNRRLLYLLPLRTTRMGHSPRPRGNEDPSLFSHRPYSLQCSTLRLSPSTRASSSLGKSQTLSQNTSAESSMWKEACLILFRCLEAFTVMCDTDSATNCCPIFCCCGYQEEG